MDTQNTLLADAAPQTSPVADATGVAANERLAAALYPKTGRLVDVAPNAAVQALRDDPARKMYRDESKFGPNGGALRELALATNPGGSRAELESQQRVTAAVMTDIGMGRDDVSQLASFAAQFIAKPPTPEERAASQRTAFKDLRQTYGEGFDDAVRDAKLMVQRDPRLAVFLDKTALGDHPWVVARITELARAQRAAGKLK